MIAILGDLIADFSLRIPSFPVRAGDLTRAEYLELGPGGACNVAIAGARLGLEVACLGEVGDDRFGRIVVEGLASEGIDVADIVISEGAETPVAGVVVDTAAEPAYLGYRGVLHIRELKDEWRTSIESARGLFAGGWADHEDVPAIILDGLGAARSAGALTFFDPGPGNPEFDREWHRDAARLATVILATEDEANRLTGLADPLNAALTLLDIGPELVIIKRGVAGCLLLSQDQVLIAPGFPVEVKDATAAGDSLAAAVIYSRLRDYPLEMLGTLANAAGAAKVQKLGTGRNVPTAEEIRQVLRRFGREPDSFLPSPA